MNDVTIKNDDEDSIRIEEIKSSLEAATKESILHTAAIALFSHEKQHNKMLDLLAEIEKFSIFILEIIPNLSPNNSRKAIEHLESLAAASMSKAGTDARHASTRLAKIFVISEWKKNSQAYENNKSAFTRDYVKRVFNEFDVSITEKQMREVWLRDTLPASKPDGLPVDGE